MDIKGLSVGVTGIVTAKLAGLGLSFFVPVALRLPCWGWLSRLLDVLLCIEEGQLWQSR